MGYWGNQNVPAYPNFNPYTNYYNDNTSSSPNYSWGSNNYPTQPPNFYQQQPVYQPPSFQNIRQSQFCQEAIANSKRNRENAMLEELLAMDKQQNAESEKAAKDHLEFMAQFDWNVASADSSQLESQEDVDYAEKTENPENRVPTDRSELPTDRLEGTEQQQENSTDRSLLQPVGQNSRTADFEIFESDTGCSDTVGSDRDSDLCSEYSELSEDSCLGGAEWEKYFGPTDAAGEESEVESELVVVEEEDTPKEDATPTLVRYTDVDFIFPSFQVPCQLSESAMKFYAEMSYGKTRSRDFPYRPYNFSKTKWHKILIRESHSLIKSGVYQRKGGISGALFDWLIWVATKVKLPKTIIRET